MKKSNNLKVIKMFFIAILLFAAGISNAQIGIGIANPAASAQLEVNSTTKGFLPPRMTAEQRLAIVNPVAGLVIWCSNCTAAGELQVYNGTRWTNMVGDPTFPLQVGDRYGGGIVFSVTDNGNHGYIAATEDVGSTYWSDAQRACNSYRGGGFNDWFFPPSSVTVEMFYFDHLYSNRALGLVYIWGGNDQENIIVMWQLKYGPPGGMYGATETGPGYSRPVRAF
jgi:hypothetical protein